MLQKRKHLIVYIFLLITLIEYVQRILMQLDFDDHSGLITDITLKISKLEQQNSTTLSAGTIMENSVIMYEKFIHNYI